MLATPAFGSSVSEAPFQIYDAYEFGPWGAQPALCGSPNIIAF